MQFIIIVGEAQQTAVTSEGSKLPWPRGCFPCKGICLSVRLSAHLPPRSQDSLVQGSGFLSSICGAELSGEKDEICVSGRDALHSLEARIPPWLLHRAGGHSVSSLPLSGARQRRSLLHTRNVDEAVRGIQAFVWTSLEARACRNRENLCLDVKPGSQ